jgi:hypothetical protein
VLNLRGAVREVVARYFVEVGEGEDQLSRERIVRLSSA